MVIYVFVYIAFLPTLAFNIAEWLAQFELIPSERRILSTTTLNYFLFLTILIPIVRM